MHKVNLLPPTATQRFRQKRTVVVWGKLLPVIILTMLLTIGWGQSTAARIKAQIEGQLSLTQRPTEIRQVHQDLKAQFRALNRMQTEQVELRSRFSPLVVVQLLHQLKQDFNGKLQVTSIDFVEQCQPSSASKASSNGHVTLQMIVDGTTNCSDSMQRIREAGLFCDVKLGSALELVDPNSEALRFTLRCEF